MPVSRFLFFTKYYLKKHVTRDLSANDIFQKKLFRLQNKVAGSVISHSPGEVLFEVTDVNGKAVRLVMRGQHSSDVQVIDQVFAGKEYAPLVAEIVRKGEQANIKFIIDAGSNVGYTTVYLKSFFVDATVIAIEPDHSNVIQAEKNFSLNRLENISLVEGGIWSKDSWLELKNDLRDGKEWSFYVAESQTPTGMKGFSFDTLLKGYPFTTIDILKIDIEGGEMQLFSNQEMMDHILKKTKFLAIEIHDETKVRPLILDSLKANGFEWFDRGELTIATNTLLVS